MPEIIYDYDGVPTIREFSRDNTLVRGLMGPFGSGKSTGCIIEILKRAQTQPPGPDGIRRSRWAVIRNTYPQLKDTTIRTVKSWLPEQHFGQYKQSAHEYEITKIPGCHIELLFRALDRPEHVANLLSLDLTAAWVNEAREVPWVVIQALIGRIGRYPAVKDGGVDWYGIIMDSNPPDDESWWYKQFEEVRPTGWRLFKQPSGRSEQAENLDHLPKGYYKNLSESMDSETTKVYVDGKYGYLKEGRPVYPDYNDTLHCVECKPISSKPILRGWDFGLTPACVFTQMLPSGGWVIFDEMTAEDSGIDRFGDAVNEYCGQMYKGFKFEDYGDPAGNQKAQTDEKTCYQILSKKGIKIIPGLQDLTSRIESVSKPLRTLIGGKPQLSIDPKCKVLRRGFQGKYEYKKILSSERFHEKPDKNEYSHPHDALQYIATKLFLMNKQPAKGPTPQPKYKVL